MPQETRTGAASRADRGAPRHLTRRISRLSAPLSTDGVDGPMTKVWISLAKPPATWRAIAWSKNSHRDERRRKARLTRAPRCGSGGGTTSTRRVRRADRSAVIANVGAERPLPPARRAASADGQAVDACGACADSGCSAVRPAAWRRRPRRDRSSRYARPVPTEGTSPHARCPPARRACPAGCRS